MIRTRTIDRYEGFRALSTCVVRSALFVFHHIGKRLVTASATRKRHETSRSMLRRKAVSHVGRGLTSAVLQARSNCCYILTVCSLDVTFMCGPPCYDEQDGHDDVGHHREHIASPTVALAREILQSNTPSCILVC